MEKISKIGMIEKTINVEVVDSAFCAGCPLYSEEMIGKTTVYYDNQKYCVSEHYRCEHVDNCRVLLGHLKDNPDETIFFAIYLDM